MKTAFNETTLEVYSSSLIIWQIVYVIILIIVLIFIFKLYKKLMLFLDKGIKYLDKKLEDQ